MGPDSAMELQNRVQVCDEGHHHLPTSWTIYVVDPDTAYDAKSYGKALFPVEVFDTKEQVDSLYSLDAFSPPNGPPHWSMVVPGGAIAVFQGGKFGFPSVKPEWEDPAARNGGELRFVFAQGTSPLEQIDGIFAALVGWMTERPHYAGASILGLFVKNVLAAGSKLDAASNLAIQFRLWISEAAPQAVTAVTWYIARGMAKVLGHAGAKGVITYRSLGELIDRSKAGQAGRPGEEERDPRRINLRIGVPMVPGINGERPRSPFR